LQTRRVGGQLDHHIDGDIGATCVCSSSRRRLLFATVPNKGKGEATEECSCV